MREMMGKQRLAGLISSTMLVMVLMAGCAQGAPAVQRGPGRVAPAKVVSVTPATEQALQSTLTYPGTLAAGTQVDLVARTSGVIVKFPIQPGQAVKAGQLIAQLDDTTQQAALQQAQAALAVAEANLAKLQNGPTPTQIGVAKAGVTGAQTSVQNAQQNIQVAQQLAAADSQAGQQAVTNAEASLHAAEQQLSVVKDPQGPYLTAVANAQRALTDAQNNLKVVQQQVAASLAADETTVQNAQAAIEAEQRNIAATAQVQQQQLAQAQDALYAAQVARDAACNTSNRTYTQASCDAGNANVNTEETAINTVQAEIQQAQAQAQQQLTTLEGQLKAAEQAAAQDRAKQVANSQAAQAAVTSAEDALKAAQASYAQALTQSQAQVVAAQNALSAAEAALPQTEEKDAASIVQAEGALRTAQAAVTSAQASYANVVAPPAPTDLQVAEAQVKQAQAQVTAAEAALEEMKITAPFNGILASQLLQAGALASPTTPVATLVSSDVQVQVNVAQTDIAQIKVGEPVALTVNGYPGVTFPAKITLIAPVANATTHAFQVTITPNPADPRLKPGMFATVLITTASAPHAVVVPTDAIIQQQGKPVVYVVRNDKVQVVPVQTGITTGNVTQILSGITPGMPIVTVGQNGLRAGETVLTAVGGGNGAAGGSHASSTRTGTTTERRAAAKATPTP